MFGEGRAACLIAAERIDKSSPVLVLVLVPTRRVARKMSDGARLEGSKKAEVASVLLRRQAISLSLAAM